MLVVLIPVQLILLLDLTVSSIPLSLLVVEEEDIIILVQVMLALMLGDPVVVLKLKTGIRVMVLEMYMLQIPLFTLLQHQDKEMLVVAHHHQIIPATIQAAVAVEEPVVLVEM